jgi:hypothetical protein
MHNPWSTLNSFFTVWIGLNDTVTEGDFVWVSSGNMASGVYTKWATDEPNDAHDNEDCVEIIYTSGNWNDEICSQVWHYICEKESISM